jgi:hypothetical protein
MRRPGQVIERARAGLRGGLPGSIVFIVFTPMLSHCKQTAELPQGDDLPAGDANNGGLAAFLR